MSKVLERLMQKGLLQPLPNANLPNPNTPDYNPNKYCNFHQAIGHPTDTCIRLKHEIQDLIDSEKITDPENPNTRTNPFPNYRNVPPPASMMINSGVSEEEILNSFEDMSLQEIPHAPKNEEKVEDLLGQPSGKFDYKVFYSKPPSYDIPMESIIPEGWGDEFEDDGSVSEKDQRVENSEQPLSGQQLSKFEDEKQLDKKEACTVEIWKDEVTEEIQE